MSIRQATSARARVVRRVTVSENDVTVDGTLGNWTSVSLVAPEDVPYRAEENPRDVPAYTLSWPAGYRGLGLLGPGSRVESATGALLELLGPPRELRSRLRATGYAAQAQLVSLLYPLEGELQERGGAVVGDISFAMWSEFERGTSTGRFEDFESHAPIDFRDSASIDRQISLDGIEYKITEVEINYGRARVDMLLRRLARG